MLLDVVSPVPRRVWEEIVEADPESMPTQTPRWCDAAGDGLVSHDASRLYRFADGTEAVLPAVRRGGPVPAIAQLASMPNAWGFGGLVSRAPPGAEHVRAVLDDLAGSGYAQVQIRPNPMQTSAWEAAAPPDAIAVDGLEYAIDLRCGYDELYRCGFHNDVRRMARRARERGVAIRRGHGPDDVKVLMHLLRLSVRRWAARDGEPVAVALARLCARDPERKMVRITAALGPRAEIFSAWQSDRPIAAALVLFGKTAFYTRGAMDVDAVGNSGANHLLQTEAITAACDAGCTRYHMGDVAAGTGLARFKGRFGAQPHPFVTYRIERVPITRLDRGLRRTVRSVLGVTSG